MELVFQIENAEKDEFHLMMEEYFPNRPKDSSSLNTDKQNLFLSQTIFSVYTTRYLK